MFLISTGGYSVIEKALKRTFSPEFLNRIDDVIIFNQLTKENILAATENIRAQTGLKFNKIFS